MTQRAAPAAEPIRSAVYQIRLRGQLGQVWTGWFDGLAITWDDGDTLLTGAVTDQSALHGLLRKIRDLGVTLVAVNRLETSATQPVRQERIDMATSTLSITGRTPVEGVGNRATARIVGVLFIVATVTAIFGGGLVMQSLDAPDNLVQAAAHEGQVVAGVALEFVLALSVIGIAALLLPVLRPHGEAMAVGYIAVRTLEAAFILMATTTALVVLALGQDSGSAIAAGVEPVGDMLLSAREWTYFVGTMPLFGVSAVILNTVLHRSRLVPGWLSVWGLVGGLLLLVYAGAELLGVESAIPLQLLAAPIAVQEMALAGWLIAKGFTRPAPLPAAARAARPEA